MAPEQIEQHVLLEIERAKSLLEFLRTQAAPPSPRVRAALAALGYQCGVMAEPLTDEEAAAAIEEETHP